FQAEDGIRDFHVTGVQTCALPILVKSITNELQVPASAEFILEGQIVPGEIAEEGPYGDHTGYYNEVERFPVFTVTKITHRRDPKIGRASCRERVWNSRCAGWLEIE